MTKSASPATESEFSLQKGTADGRYYVVVDGVQIGWVVKLHDGWRFYAPVRSAGTGEVLASGSKTRRDALMEGFSDLGIRHLGRVFKFDLVTFEDEPVYLGKDRCDAIYRRLLDEKYPESVGS